MGNRNRRLFSLFLPPFLLFSFLWLFAGSPEDVSPAEPSPSPLPTEIPSSGPELRYARELTIYVDGTELPSPGLESEQGLHYAEASAFMDALDDSFWDGEKDSLRYDPLPHGGSDYLCVEEFCKRWSISTYLDDGSGRLWCTSAAGDWTPPAGYRVPVLMYHGVGDNLRPGAELVVKTEELERQLRHLLDRGYTPIWFEDLKHVDKIEKPVILTFDDGYRDNYTELFPLLQKYGVKATVFVVSGYLDQSTNLNRDMIREMLDSGLVSVQCHTWYHLDLDSLSYTEQVEQLCWSKVDLLELTGREPFVIAYPRGRQNDDTLSICRKEYRFGLKMGGEPYYTGDDPLLIHRISIPRRMTLEEYASILP